MYIMYLAGLWALSISVISFSPHFLLIVHKAQTQRFMYLRNLYNDNVHTKIKVQIIKHRKKQIIYIH